MRTVQAALRSSIEAFGHFHKMNYFILVSNDTGPAHICSHLNKNGLALFGSHTSSKKVNIGNSNFKVLSEKKLSNLDINTVISKIEKELN